MINALLTWIVTEKPSNIYKVESLLFTCWIVFLLKETEKISNLTSGITTTILNTLIKLYPDFEYDDGEHGKETVVSKSLF